jgi:4-hydroxy-tetrahydrodipicolinate synthase
MSKEIKKIKGVIVPVITPVDEKDCVDEKSFRAVIRRCLGAGVDGIFVGGSSGMGPLLADEQWQRAMEIAREEVGEKHSLLGGVIATSTARAVLRIRVLEQIGYRMIVVTPTFYITLVRENEMLSHFGACREATDMDMIVYNIPSCTGSNIPVKTILEMAGRGWTQICKESSGNRSYFSELLEKGRDLNLRVFQGYEPDIQWGLLLGVAGIVPVCANYEPQTFVAAWHAAQEGNIKLLSKAQERISSIRQILLLGNKNWISGIMYGVSTLGIGSGRPVLPLQELSSQAKQLIDRLKVKK